MDFGFHAAAVLDHVLQRLLYDPVEAQRHVAGDLARYRYVREAHVQRLLAEQLLAQAADRGDQAERVEPARVQPVRDAMHIGGDTRSRLRERLPSLTAVAGVTALELEVLDLD